MAFQGTVNLQQAPAIAGDFASSNPRASLPSPEGAFVAGAAGVTVGRFAWVQSDGVTVLNTGTGKPDGFVHREQQALITAYLADNSRLVPQGFAVTLMRTGDYYATANVSSAVRLEKAFASTTDGSIQFAAAGSTIAGYVETDFVCTVAAALGELAVMSL